MEFAPVLWNPMHDASSAVPAQEIHFMASQNNRNVPSEKNQMSTQVSNSNNTRNHKQHASERIMTMTKPKSSCGKPGLDVSRRPQYVSPNVQQLNMRNSTKVKNLRGTMKSEKHTHNTETTKPSGPCSIRATNRRQALSAERERETKRITDSSLHFRSAAETPVYKIKSRTSQLTRTLQTLSHKKIKKKKRMDAIPPKHTSNRRA